MANIPSQWISALILFYVRFSTRLFQPQPFKIAVHCLESFFIDWSLLVTMIEIGLIVVYSSLVVLTLLTCGGTKNGKATAPPPGVLGAPTKDESPAPATAASSTEDPAPTLEASSTVAPTPPSAVSTAAPSVDRADAPSDVPTASSLVSTASTPTVATAASPSVATAASPSVVELDEHKGHILKYVESESLEGNFDGFGLKYSPSKRYAAMVMRWEGDTVIFPLAIMDVCSSSYNVYNHDKSEKERIEQLQNGTQYWLADDMIVIMQYKNEQLQRTIYELDHKKKTVSFVYTGEDTCKFAIESNEDGNAVGFSMVNILKRNCLLVFGTDYRYFQLYHCDPRVAPMFTHPFYIQLRRIRRHLQLTGDDDGVVQVPICCGSKMRFLLTKERDEDGSTKRAPSQILTFDLEKVVQKQLRENEDVVTIGAGDLDCWSIMTLDPVDPDIVVPFDSLLYPGPSSVISFDKNHSNDKAGAIVHYDVIVIDYNTKKCHKMNFSGKRRTRTYLHQYPLVRIEEWTWDDVRGGPCWTTLASFPPKAVPTLQDLCRDAVLKNREKYSQDLPDYAGILFPIVDM